MTKGFRVLSCRIIRKRVVSCPIAVARPSLIPNYGERYRCGERIASSFVESTVNQVVSKRFVKKQQMRWSKKGAHLLLQVRNLVINQELRQRINSWYSQSMPPVPATSG